MNFFDFVRKVDCNDIFNGFNEEFRTKSDPYLEKNNKKLKILQKFEECCGTKCQVKFTILKMIQIRIFILALIAQSSDTERNPIERDAGHDCYAKNVSYNLIQMSYLNL